MKRNKVPGIDNMPAEVFQASDMAANALVDPLKCIWNSEQMPAENAVGTMIIMYKKGSKDDRSNYRAVFLLPHSFKILSMCILHRLRPLIEHQLPGTQAGFRSARGCRDNNCTLTWIINRHLECGR